MRHSATFLKQLILIKVGVLFLLTASGQYYYNDILAPSEYSQWKLFKLNKVAAVQLKSFEGANLPSEGFTGNITVKSDYSEIRSFSQSEQIKANVTVSYFDAQGNLQTSKDSSEEVVTTYSYYFDPQGKLTEVTSISVSADGKSRQKELHKWTYTPDGAPSKMLRIRNESDTTFVKFTIGANNLVEEERSYRKGELVDQVYYYYDEQNRLTDEVRYNRKLKKLVPDFTFEYNDEGFLFQRMTVFNATDYLIWRYEYNEKGLRTRDLCFNKQKKLVGRIEYSYTYR